MNKEWNNELKVTCATYPHIYQRLSRLKLDIQKANYMSTLLIEERDGGRRGFDRAAAAEMTKFIARHGGNHSVDFTFTLS